MAVKLKVWNAALRALGDRKLDDTGEKILPGRALTDVWDDVVEECLTDASWNFATETVKLVADTGVTPQFGDFTEVFAKPTDWLNTVKISMDENFALPLTQYDDERNYFTTSVSPIYVKYVSNDTGMGLDLAQWPVRFARYVELNLADRIGLRLTQDEGRLDAIKTDLRIAKTRARSQDSMNEPQPRWPPPGSWTRSRGSRTSGERGSRSSLTG